MSHTCRLLPYDFLTALALAVSTHASAIGPDTATPEVHFQYEIAYVSGGVRSDKRDAMRTVVRRFNIRLNVVPASIDKALSDADMSAVDDRGKLRLCACTEGPLLYMRLPHGHCQIAIAYRGATQTVNVSVDAQSIDAVVRSRTEPGPDE